MLSATRTITSVTGPVIDPYAILKELEVHEGEHIADFGCGQGHFVFPAAKMVGESGRVFAIDIQQELVHAIESRAQSFGLTNIEGICADAEKFGSTKIPAGTLGLALLVNNQIGAGEFNNMLREAMRVVKSGGHVVVIDWLGGKTVPFAPAIVSRVEKDVAIRIAQTLGLRFVDEFKPARYHYGLRFQKV